MNRLFSLAILLSAASLASAQPSMDGSLIGDEAFYGPALSVQNTKTGYGDAQNGDPVNGGGGSEIDQVFATVSGDRLYVLIAGNLEPNYNKLNVFIDSTAGGVNTINGASLPTGMDAFCCGQTDPSVDPGDGALQRLDGLTFDAGFTADRYLVFSNGFENVNARDSGGGAVDPDEPQLTFWAVNAHMADLTQGSAGAVQGLGYQLAHRGLPNPLRTPFDYNQNGQIDAADYTVWRDSLNDEGDSAADGNNDGVVDQIDYDNWANNYGKSTGLSGTAYAPQNGSEQISEKLLSAESFPGLNQGDLIDKNYAMGDGGCTNNEGDGCVAEELEFALDAAADEVNNGSNHRGYLNTADLRMAFDNSNTQGVAGSGSLPWATDGADNPADVTTGLEFSIPLSELGNPAGQIKLMAFIGNGSFDYMSNQFSGAGLQDANLDQVLINAGGPPLGSLADIPGDQFVTITLPSLASAGAAAAPEPGAVILLAAGLVTGALTRRRAPSVAWPS
ncbi:hypothetical protein Pla123a_31860 [Posidoniimonas polymericola]|uniref:PEP-CTERM protein-sorting domain-containing protein n=1 Tax=Posidoniimonas polymericola TaxID=2528002 RepID=A0A5C5YLE8_9BACT|nr:PEP-CTERM sorting domain-containing protein [Posidoniimonas polymericola]TWT75676.1 hypothetical protein Pla123a_31860 [Posidoniimonas polymericola]